MVKNTETSCFVEFSFIDIKKIQSKNIADLIAKADKEITAEKPQLGVSISRFN